MADFSFLLPAAISNLNLETVKVLVELGADVNMTIMLYRDWDSDSTFFGSPLLFPFLALLLGPRAFLKFPDEEFMNVFRVDHPKLLDIMTFLLESGANPEQKIMRFPGEVLKLDFNRQDFEITHSLKDYAKLILDDPNANFHTTSFLEFLEKVIYQPFDNKWSKPPSTIEEIKSFIQFANQSSNEPSQENEDENTNYRCSLL